MHAVMEVLQVRHMQSSSRKSSLSDSGLIFFFFSRFTAFFFLFITCSSPIKKGEAKIRSLFLWSVKFFVSCARVLLLNALSAAGDGADRLWAGSSTAKSHRQGCWWLWQIAWLLCCGSALHSDCLNLIISRSSFEEMLWQAEILFQW